jgi:hypothetical protein
MHNLTTKSTQTHNQQKIFKNSSHEASHLEPFFIVILHTNIKNTTPNKIPTQVVTFYKHLKI